MPCDTKNILDGVHVVLVEDDDDSREMLEAILEYCGALVTAAATALDALRLMARMRPAIIVTDIMMPDYDGFWLVRAVRSLPDAKGIPVIAVTGMHDDDRVRAGGFDGYLKKPVEPDLLCEVIQGALGRNT